MGNYFLIIYLDLLLGIFYFIITIIVFLLIVGYNKICKIKNGYLFLNKCNFSE